MIWHYDIEIKIQFTIQNYLRQFEDIL